MRGGLGPRRPPARRPVCGAVGTAGGGDVARPPRAGPGRRGARGGARRRAPRAARPGPADRAWTRVRARGRERIAGEGCFGGRRGSRARRDRDAGAGRERLGAPCWNRRGPGGRDRRSAGRRPGRPMRPGRLDASRGPDRLRPRGAPWRARARGGGGTRPRRSRVGRRAGRGSGRCRGVGDRAERDRGGRGGGRPRPRRRRVGGPATAAGAFRIALEAAGEAPPRSEGAVAVVAGGRATPPPRPGPAGRGRLGRGPGARGLAAALAASPGRAGLVLVDGRREAVIAEATALGRAFREGPRRAALASARAWLGDAGAASDLAALAAAALCLERCVRPAIPGWAAPGPAALKGAGGLMASDEPAFWHATPEMPERRALVLLGGAVAALEAGPARARASATALCEGRPALLPLAAADRAGLESGLRALEAALDAGGRVPDLARHAIAGAAPDLPLRLALVAAEPRELRRELGFMRRALDKAEGGAARAHAGRLGPGAPADRPARPGGLRLSRQRQRLSRARPRDHPGLRGPHGRRRARVRPPPARAHGRGARPARDADPAHRGRARGAGAPAQRRHGGAAARRAWPSRSCTRG